MKFIFNIFLIFLFLESVVEAKDKNCNNLVVGGHPDWPPMSEYYKKSYSGLAWETTDQIFKKLKIKYTRYDRKKSMSFQRMLLKKGVLDAFVTYTRSADHDKFFDLSAQYLENKISLYQNRTNYFPFSVIYSIQGKKGLINNNLYLGHTQETFARYYLDLKRRASDKEMAKELYDKKVDYVIWPEAHGDKLLKDLRMSDMIVKAETPIERQYVHIAFSEDSGCLRIMDKIDKIVAEIVTKREEEEKRKLKENRKKKKKKSI